MISYERRVVHLELLHRVLHLRVFVGLDGEYAREDIGCDPLESRDSVLGFAFSGEYRITDTCLGDGLQSRDDIADLSFVYGVCWRIFRTKTSDFKCLDLGSSIDEFELVSFSDLSREELQVDNDSLVRIILRVEYESLDCSVILSLR